MEIWILLAFFCGFGLALTPSSVVIIKGSEQEKMVVEYNGHLYKLVRDV